MVFNDDDLTDWAEGRRRDLFAHRVVSTETFDRMLEALRDKPENYWPPSDFTGTQFAISNFNGRTFPKLTTFEQAFWTEAPLFDGCTFEGLTSFEGAVFVDWAIFKSCTWKGAAYFGGAKFLQTALFDDSRFQQGANFSGVTFRGDVDFNGCSFSGGAHFVRARFEGKASFQRAEFKQVSLFAEATVMDLLDLSDSRCGSDISFSGSLFWRAPDLDGIHCDGQFSMLGVEILGKMAIRRANFGGVCHIGPLVVQGSFCYEMYRLQLIPRWRPMPSGFA